jgi:hypothetical protein
MVLRHTVEGGHGRRRSAINSILPLDVAFIEDK